MDEATYNVRVYRIEVYKGARVTSYRVRWKAGHRLWREGFRNAALADSFRSSLLTAARKGEAFSLTTGRPVSWKRDDSPLSWYALTLAYTAAKWPYAAPNHRKSIAEALTDATEAMLATDEPPLASISRTTHQARTGASSPAHAAASSTTGPTSRSSIRPALPPLSPASPRHCWPGAPTICGTRRSPPG